MVRARDVATGAGQAGEKLFASGPFQSPNWSGYADTGPSAQFTGVSAMWTVPTVKAGARGDSATWVGVDGFTNQDLVQAGTDQSSGSYYAWYELIPQVAFSLGPVKPGDQMHADVSQQSPGTWAVTLEDLTQKVTWSGPVAYYAQETSAEWVEEAPTNASNDTIEAMADYGSVRFSDMTVTGPGTASATAQPVYLVDGSSGQVVSYPSQYDASTDSFVASYGQPPNGVTAFPAVPIEGTSPTTSRPGTGPAPPTSTTAPAAPSTTALATGPHGYWLAGADGGIFSFGNAHFYGSAAGLPLAQPVTGMAATPDDNGYWLASANGEVFAFGDAVFHGSLPGLGIGPAGARTAPHLSAPVVGISASTGSGYWLVTGDGQVYAFGGAHFAGSCATVTTCDAPAVALVPDAAGNGYWLLLSDAKMLAFGGAKAVDDKDCQSASHSGLTATAARSTNDGGGYWVALDNGSTCAEGDALRQSIWEAYQVTTSKDPAVALFTDKQGQGAWLALARGSVDRYGDAPRFGDMNGHQLAAPIVAAAGF